MNKKIFIIIGLIFIGIVVSLFALFRNPNTQPPIIQEPTAKPGIQDNGGISTTPNASPGSSNNNTLTITTATGGTIQTRNFKNDPETFKNPLIKGYYSLGFHFVDGQGENIPYVIDFIEETDYFNIVLYQEPLGQSRKKAEQHLMEQLGISQNEMCELQYMVSVPDNVSGFYTSRSLGFSFCPGSVVIPE